MMAKIVSQTRNMHTIRPNVHPALKRLVTTNCKESKEKGRVTRSQKLGYSIRDGCYTRLLYSVCMGTRNEGSYNDGAK